MKFGLVGYPLSHSFSRKYFEKKFQDLDLTDFSYQNFSIQNIENIVPILNSDMFGLNVTIPYKTSVMEYVHAFDSVSIQIGAVNTLVRTGLNSWKGYNTDESGFKQSLEEWMQGHSYPERALILGTGGVAKAIRFALLSLGIRPSFVSRGPHADYSYETLTKDVIGNHLLVINATPKGMEPYKESPLIPYDALTPEHWLYDVVYNPTNTLFLTHGMQMKARTKNGLDMLHLQADHAWNIWKLYGKF